MRPRLASLIFSLIVVLAVGALAWGATHGKATGNGIGSKKDQAAARTTLQTGLKLSGGLVRDPTFTACGKAADACLTGNTSLATTLAALATVVHAAGGSVPSVCSAPPAGVALATGANFTCLAEGRLHGTPVLFLLGDGWSLPGHPTPRTAILINVEKDSPTSPTLQPATPATAADAAALLPPTWARAPQPCAGAATSSPSTAAALPSASATTTAAPLLTTSPPLPPCSQTALTENISVHAALSAASSQLAALALSKGFRLDGKPCIAGSTATSCGIWGERISSGVQQLFVATLTDDGRGDTTGTLSVTDQKSSTEQG